MVSIYADTWCHFPEESNIHVHCGIKLRIHRINPIRNGKVRGYSRDTAVRLHGSWGVPSLTRDLDNKWTWMFSFTPRPIYLGEIAPVTHRVGDSVNLSAGVTSPAPVGNRTTIPEM